MQYATAGIEFLAIFGLMVMAGLLLDRRFDSLPVWTIVGTVLGFAGGVHRLVKIARSLDVKRK